MYWDQLTSPQIEALNRNIPVILPVSATEQHGPHLPLATDRLIGEHFCKEIHEQMPDDVLVLPSIAVGCSEHHTDFTGSLSLRHETLLHQMTEIAGWVVHYGFKNLVVLNSHGGNQAIGQTFLESFGYRHPTCKVVFLTWWRIALEALKNISESGPGGVGHACEFETSLMLLIASELVHKDKIPLKSTTPTYEWAEADMLRGSAASLYRRFSEITPNGVIGVPAMASSQKGERITKVVVDKLKIIISDLRNAN